MPPTQKSTVEWPPEDSMHTTLKRCFTWAAALLLATSLSGCGYNDFQRLDEQSKSA
jgi:LemA protein